MNGIEFEDSCGWYCMIIRDIGCSDNSFGIWSSIKSLFVHYEAIAISFHSFQLKEKDDMLNSYF